MFSHNPPNRLEVKLKKVLCSYETLACHDPDILRLLIPENEVWRFFIDSHHQPRGWQPYEEREPGYMLAMHQAFDFIMKKSGGLTLAYIKDLHHHAINGVRGTNYDKIDNAMYDFRNSAASGIRFPLVTKHNFTRLGLYEFLDKNSRAFNGKNVSVRTGQITPIAINNHSLNAFKQLAEEMQPGYDFDDDTNACHSREYLESISNKLVELNVLNNALVTHDTHQLLRVIHRVGIAGDLHEAVNNIYLLCKEQHAAVWFESTLPVNTESNLHDEIHSHIQAYESSIASKKTKLEKLKCIVMFIQKCEQTHPFADANCRTFCMLLLNHLLINNGFPMVILRNPNRFDMCSVNELIQDVIKGMENVFALIRDKKLFGADTNQLIDKEKIPDETRHQQGLFSASTTTSSSSALATLNNSMSAETNARKRKRS